MNKFTETALLNELYGIKQRNESRFNDAYDKKLWNTLQVSKIQTAFMIVAIELINYNLLLEERTTLEYESFLINKLDNMIIDLQNAKGRIKADSQKNE